MSEYKGLFTFDIDNHRYIPIGQADGIVVVNDADYATTEPLIKDPKIRKAVRAWAEANEVKKVYVYGIGDGKEYIELYAQDNGVTDGRIRISMKTQGGIWIGKEYTIAKLCGIINH